jgi:hypothetical protein
MKKVGELQVEIDQYKNMIKLINEEVQKIKANYLEQIGFKEQEIQIGRS